MSSGIRPSTSFVDIDACWVNVGGTWRTVDSINGNVSAVGWREFWSAASPVSLSDKTVSDSGSTIRPYSAQATFLSDGVHRTITYGTSGNGYFDEWYVGAPVPNPGVGNDYEIRATEVSQTGSATRIGTMGTWISLSSGRAWSLEENNPSQGYREWIIDFEIRDTATQTIQASCRINLNFEYAP